MKNILNLSLWEKILLCNFSTSIFSSLHLNEAPRCISNCKDRQKDLHILPHRLAHSIVVCMYCSARNNCALQTNAKMRVAAKAHNFVSH